ncbi:ferritin-like domain-containing protein [Halococcus saccharolyticus]|uniref:Ferritin Dps family protein n=1 Tax=Halococcus saccharolyticus DSM 5350 TaxID=1227455 RepID=M0MKK3_9EURY|nr:ferritin-like domain-containing protein [Halococcus saccharolyticus]EMA44965.1 Ferritin Dps family protein [Halococcus saccharolyticus DSM 5350]
MSVEGDDRVLELLEDARNDEFETVINYQTNAAALAGVAAEEIADSLSADVQEELGHAEEIGERITQLGGQPKGSFDLEMGQEELQPPEDPTDVLSVIDGVIAAEEGAVETYRELIEVAEEAGDPVTEDFATELLADEEEHLAEFEGYRKEYED